MTSKIEKEFYKVFEIAPATIQEYGETYFLDTIEIDGKRYTKIDANKLLEMICIYNNNVYENEKITPSNINTLKEDVLHWIIDDFEGNEKFKYQIQQLFKD